MDHENCQCFTCANKNNPVAVKAYLIGQIEAYKDVVEGLKRCGVNIEPLTNGDTLGALLTECLYNLDAAGCLITELKDVHLEGRTAKEIDGD